MEMITAEQEKIATHAGQGVAEFTPELQGGESIGDYVIREAKARSYPTSDAFAAWLWRWSNSREVGPSKAACIMRQAGYMPFMGFPLRRISPER
jgi:hypothetical protein